MHFFSAAVLLLAGAVNLYFELKKRRSCSAPAEAAVVEIKRNRTFCVPILEYRASGKRVRGDIGLVSQKRIGRYRIGQKMQIFYDPDKPENFRIAGQNGVLFVSAALLTMGTAGLVLLFLF